MTAEIISGPVVILRQLRRLRQRRTKAEVSGRIAGRGIKKIGDRIATTGNSSRLNHLAENLLNTTANPNHNSSSSPGTIRFPETKRPRLTTDRKINPQMKTTTSFLTRNSDSCCRPSPTSRSNTNSSTPTSHRRISSTSS